MGAISKDFLDTLIASEHNAKIKRNISSFKFFQAKVVDCKDTEKQGRVKIWIPDLMYGSISENDGIWAMPGNNPFTGNKDSSEVGLDDCGTCMIPPVGSYVLIFFEDGDFSYPRYFGGINKECDESIPIENQYGTEWWKKWTLLKTPGGRQILISDDDDDSGIIIRGKYANRGLRTDNSDPRYPSDSQYIQMWEKDGEEYILIKDADGNYIKMDQTNNKIRIQHTIGSYIELLPDGNINIESKNNIYLNTFGSNYENPY